MFLIGLTGGIATGKSTVARIMCKRGAAVIDADAIGKDLLQPGTDAARAIGRIVHDVLSPDGIIDRRKLSDAAFADPAVRHTLESILHPLIYDEIALRISAAEKAGTDILVVEAALLLETKALWPDEFRPDAIVIVLAAEQEQVDRLVRIRGLTEEQARARIAAQPKSSIGLYGDALVIRNSGPRHNLDEELDRVWALVPVGEV